MNSWTDEHDRLLSDTAPPVPEASDAELQRVWNRVAGGVDSAGPRRRHGRVVVGAVVGALVLGTSGVAAAHMWSARTGEFQTDEESIRLSGPGEIIDPAGTDYEQVLREEITDIPYPSDRARELAVAEQVRLARREAAHMRAAAERGDGFISREVTGGMRAEAARQAICAWANTWAATTAAGDTAGRAEAIGMLEAARTWPAITDVDADQTITPKTMTVKDAETGRTWQQDYLDNTPFGWLPLVAEAAHGRDFQAVGEPFLEYTSCIPELMRDLPAAVPPEWRVQ